MRWILMIGFTIFVAMIGAKLEVQIEGKHGWAKKLPCWRKETGLLMKLSGGRPITGYHVWWTAFVVTMFHFFFLGFPWSLRAELFITGLLFLFFVVEDFLWFIVNPAFGLKKFKKNEIPWHRWLGPVPDWYWLNTSAVIVLVYLGIPGIA